jgi:hypothetical protein
VIENPKKSAVKSLMNVDFIVVSKES